MPAPIGNTFWMLQDTHGREKLWTSPEEMQDAITQYFQDCADKMGTIVTKDGDRIQVNTPEIPTIEGLARSLGFESTASLLNYQEKPGYEAFFATIKAAKLYITEQKVSGLINGRGSATGLIFDLKNNHGYKDKQEVDNNVNMNGRPPWLGITSPNEKD